MNIQLIRIVSVVFLAAASVFAQGPQTVIAEIPFGFHVGDSSFTAGRYTVDAVAPKVLRVKSDGQKSAALILTHSVERRGSGQAKLIFHRYGNEYYLSQVWDFGNLGSEVPVTKREVELSAAARRVNEPVVAGLGTKR